MRGTVEGLTKGLEKKDLEKVLELLAGESDRSSRSDASLPRKGTQCHFASICVNLPQTTSVLIGSARRAARLIDTDVYASGTVQSYRRVPESIG